MNAPVIRVSIGRFDAENADAVETRLVASKAGLESGIRAMKGNLGFFAGIDRVNHAMHNVSMWESVADANQMATFAPMLALAVEFTGLGVRFQQPILNFDTLWQID
jgi:hypothetical protein